MYKAFSLNLAAFADSLRICVKNINNLRKLYPNYFLDTQEFVKFLDIVNKEIEKYEN